MPNQTARAQLSQAIELATIGGTPLLVTVTNIEVRDGASCRIRVEVMPKTFERIRRDGHLGLDAPDAADPPLDSDRPVKLELALRPYLVEAAAEHGEPMEVIARALLSPDELDLRAADAWRVLNVTQAVDLPEGQEGFADAGYQTVWGRADRDGAMSGPVPMANVVRSVFESSPWDLEAIDGDELFRARISTTDGHGWMCLVRLSPDDGLCAVYAVHPRRVPESARAEVAQLLLSLNYELPVGAFEMDTEDGEVRFRSGLDVGDDALSAAAFTRLLQGNIGLMDGHMAVLDELCTEG